MTQSRIFLLCSILAFAPSTGWSQGSLVIQRCPLAGFTYHQAPQLWTDLREGDELILMLERENAHDSQAVRVTWRDQTIGYLPRNLNGAIARALDGGIRLNAHILHLREHPDPRRRVEIEIRVLLDSANRSP